MTRPPTRNDLLRRVAELEQERAATTGVLQAISQSSADLQGVLDTICESAARLCGAPDAQLWRGDASGHQRAAGFGQRFAGETSPRWVANDRTQVGGRAMLDRQTVHLADLLAEPDEEFGQSKRAAERLGHRSILAAPLLMQGNAIGALIVSRPDIAPFTAQQIAVLGSFADQAVIAIQNARLFQELALKSQQLEEASRHKSEFLANMSHELRTPLNAIIGFTEVLLEKYFGEVNEKQEDYLKDVLTSGQHLLALINDILDLSKVEAGRMELEVAPFDLGHALEAGLVMVKERATKKGIELSLEVGEDVGR